MSTTPTMVRRRRVWVFDPDQMLSAKGGKLAFGVGESMQFLFQSLARQYLTFGQHFAIQLK